jgi:hypothetical protein
MTWSARSSSDGVVVDYEDGVLSVESSSGTTVYNLRSPAVVKVDIRP